MFRPCLAKTSQNVSPVTTANVKHQHFENAACVPFGTLPLERGNKISFQIATDTHQPFKNTVPPITESPVHTTFVINPYGQRCGLGNAFPIKHERKDGPFR